MERAFIVTKKSDYYKTLERCFENYDKQKEFVQEFFREHNIEAKGYRLRGDGFCNSPFEEYAKKNITLAIVPNENDEKNYGKILGKLFEGGYKYFRKNSGLMKEFQQRCVEKMVMINIVKPDLRDYFKTMGWNSYNCCHIPCEAGYYLRIDSSWLEDDDNPEGFIPIKLSEFYKHKAVYDEKRGR